MREELGEGGWPGDSRCTGQGAGRCWRVCMERGEQELAWRAEESEAMRKGQQVIRALLLEHSRTPWPFSTVTLSCSSLTCYK